MYVVLSPVVGPETPRIQKSCSGFTVSFQKWNFSAGQLGGTCEPGLDVPRVSCFVAGCWAGNPQDAAKLFWLCSFFLNMYFSSQPVGGTCEPGSMIYSADPRAFFYLFYHCLHFHCIFYIICVRHF